MSLNFLFFLSFLFNWTGLPKTGVVRIGPCPDQYIPFVSYRNSGGIAVHDMMYGSKREKFLIYFLN